MSKPLKPRRGTTAQHASFIGEAHEVTFDTDKKTLVAHDGATAGGFPLAKEVDVQGKLDTSGGTMSGVLDLGHHPIWGVNALELEPSPGAGYGGYIDFHFDGSNADFTTRIIENHEGMLDIHASNGVRVNGKNVLTSDGGTLTGAIVNNDVAVCGIDSKSNITLRGGKDYKGGADLTLFGNDYSSADYAGSLLLRSYDKSGSGKNLHIRTDGVYVDNGSVVTNDNGTANAVRDLDVFTSGNAASHRLPSGGTWRYWVVYGYDGFNALQSGVAAGGTTIEISMRHAGFAIRVV